MLTPGFVYCVYQVQSGLGSHKSARSSFCCPRISQNQHSLVRFQFPTIIVNVCGPSSMHHTFCCAVRHWQPTDRNVGVKLFQRAIDSIKVKRYVISMFSCLAFTECAIWPPLTGICCLQRSTYSACRCSNAQHCHVRGWASTSNTSKHCCEYCHNGACNGNKGRCPPQ